MPNLKDYFKSDLTTFINDKEFAVPVEIEGETVDVVMDSDKLIERKVAAQAAEGLHTDELLFHVEKSKLSFYPRPENRIRFDDSNWKIKSVQEDEGLFTITAELVSA